MNFKCLQLTLVFLLSVALLSGCNSVKEASAPIAQTETVSEIYEVHDDGRIYAFYDKKTFKEFMQVGETAYRLTRIGTGPKGETMVFGLTKGDKKSGANTPAVKLYEGTIKAAENFYAETVRHGRIYVFNAFEDMQTVRQFGHPNFFYTEIGSGPKGETVVYVLNKKTKKKKPVALMAEFKKRNTQICKAIIEDGMKKLCDMDVVAFIG